MGLATVKATPQTEPIRLELLGTTEYITDTLTKIRPMFKGRVDKVHVTVNQAVKKGDPLIDLYSKDLAEAKSDYEIEHIQWIYDKNLLDTREPLVKSKAISQQLFEETKNNEMKSRREYEVARDKLFVYGLSEAEVEQVEGEAGSQKARMTLRSPTDGFVIERDVVREPLRRERHPARHRAAGPSLGLGKRLRERPGPREPRAVVGDPVSVPGAEAPGQGRVHLQSR